MYDANYEWTIRQSDALYGFTKILERNGRRLEVKVRPGIENGNTVRLSNALNITDGLPGDILIRIGVAPTPAPVPSSGTDIDTIFQCCLSAVGGRTNEHVSKYIASRSNVISRALFYEKATWAIWEAGWGYKQCNTFLSNAVSCGFTWNYSSFGSHNGYSLNTFMQKLHGIPVPKRAIQKWKAVHSLGKRLSAFSSESHFRHDFFNDKYWGRELDKCDIERLRKFRLNYVGNANAHYIIRMLGGEAIKCDKWVKKFLSWGKLNLGELEDELRRHSIPLGFFDVVIWEYCNIFIVQFALFDEHFTHKFGYLRK